MTNKLPVNPHRNGCIHGVVPPGVCKECSSHLERLNAVNPKEAVAPEAGNVPFVAPGYNAFARILAQAFEQVARGKGAKRHGRGREWLQQPIMNIARMVGLGGHSYQIMKKTQEAQAMFERGEHDAAIAEFRGVIGYAAAAIAYIEERKNE